MRQRRRVAVLMLAVTAVLIGLILRLGYLQGIASGMLTARALDNWSKDLPVEARRGTIYDRNGVVLAYSADAKNVVAVPRQVQNAHLEASQLASVLHQDAATIERQLKQARSFVYVKGGMRIPDEMAALIAQLHLPGILLEPSTRRIYPHGSLAANVLGYVLPVDNVGASGVEATYNQYLTGVNGKLSLFTDAAGRAAPSQGPTYVAPKNGRDVVLTIDANIQSMLESELDRAMAEFDAEDALGIVVDPKSGQILAMGQRPSFDPTNPGQVPTEVRDRNLAIWKAFEPGSTFKIVTLSAALQEQKISLQEHFYDPGYIKVAGATIHDWKYGGHGDETFQQVVWNSCNPGFVEMGERLGPQTLLSYIHQFGFGQKTGIDLTGEASGILFKLNQMGPVETATTAFGQGPSVTPIQQVMALSAIANGGKRMKPYVGLQVIDPQSGQKQALQQPTQVSQVISPKIASEVLETLQGVVTYGTGRNAFLPGYAIGGKTGTAQKPAPGGGYLPGQHIMSFISVAPTDDPKLVAYLAVDSPKGPEFSSTVAPPLVRDLLQNALQYLHVPANHGSTELPKSPAGSALNLPQVVVPNLVGLQGDDATEQAAKAHLSLDARGSGAFIVAQAPPAGSLMPQGGTIVAYAGDVQPQEQPQLTLPNFSYLSTTQAQALAQLLGLQAVIAGEGNIARQQPTAGTPVKKGSQVQLWASPPPRAPLLNPSTAGETWNIGRK